MQHKSKVRIVKTLMFTFVLAAGLMAIAANTVRCDPNYAPPGLPIVLTEPGGPPPPPPPPTATPQPQEACPATAGKRCYATFEMTTGTNEAIDGAFAQFDFEAYEAASWQTGGHSNQTIWMSSGPQDVAADWCEVGWTKGYTDNLGVKHSGYTAYSVFTEPDSLYGTHTFHEFDLPSYNLGAFGTVHAFQIYRTPGTEQGIAVIDEHQLGTCDMSAFWLPDRMNIGLEYTDENSANQGVSPYDLQVRPFSDYNSAAPWQNWDQAPIATLTCVAIGRGAHVAWLDSLHQFTDSSNVAGGTSC